MKELSSYSHRYPAAGRRAKQGKVIIQTFDPAHPVIVETMHHMYDRFFERELRKENVFVSAILPHDTDRVFTKMHLHVHMLQLFMQKL
ncbi:MAG: hypothetical protein IPK35_06495 [Saprospiraceae bacterium]|nr:hypothetical protein [Saprospiraceae bacterium]